MLLCFDVALVCVNDWYNVHMWVMERDVAYGIPNPPSHAWEGETKKREKPLLGLSFNACMWKSISLYVILGPYTSLMS